MEIESNAKILDKNITEAVIDGEASTCIVTTAAVDDKPAVTVLTVITSFVLGPDLLMGVAAGLEAATQANSGATQTPEDPKSKSALQ